MRSRRIGIAVTSFAAVTALAGPAYATATTRAATASGAATASAASTAGSAVRVWASDPNAGTYLRRGPDLAWRAGSSDESAIAVDSTRKYQTMEGFGASLTDSSAWLIGTKLSTKSRADVMRDLFGPSGIGLSFLRQPMGASDFAVDGNYSYDDLPAGQTDPTLAHFSIDHDRAEIIPLLKQARALNPRLSIMATPWSPPGWMKTSDSMVGGTLRPEYEQALAEYFARFVQAYEKTGVPIRYVTPNNEPLYIPATYPGMGLSAEQARDLIANHLGPTLRKYGLTTKILGYDHNWDVSSYPESMYSDPAVARYVAGTAWHCYAGNAGAQSASHNDFPGRPAYETECSGGTWEGNDAAGFRGAMDLVVNVPRNWGKSVVRWNLALDENNGPTNNGCLTCRGLVTITDNGSVTRTVDYYALGHASAFVQPGAHRIASSSQGAGGIQDVAFENTDGTKVLIAFNAGSTRKEFTIRWGDRTLSYALNPAAAATFVWSGPQHGTVDQSALGSVDLDFGAGVRLTYAPTLGAYEDQVRVGDEWLGNTLPDTAKLTTGHAQTALDRSAWKLDAVATSPDDPLTNAIDGDPATRWSSGRGQQAGDWLLIDLGARQAFDRIVMDSTRSPGDQAHGYRIEVSDDGTSWRAVARGPSRDPRIDVEFPSTSARYIRVVDEGSAGNWWSIHELNVYAATGTQALPPESGSVRTQTARLPDGTALTAVYNPGPGAATIHRTRGSETYAYTLPATAAAIFARHPVGSSSRSQGSP